MSQKRYAVCPFFELNMPDRICCEGLGEANSTQVVFGETAIKKRWYGRYCSTFGYSACPYARALEIQYKQKPAAIGAS